MSTQPRENDVQQQVSQNEVNSTRDTAAQAPQNSETRDQSDDVQQQDG